MYLSLYFNEGKTEIEKAWKRATRITRSWEVGMASIGRRTGKARNHLPGQQGALSKYGDGPQKHKEDGLESAHHSPFSHSYEGT